MPSATTRPRNDAERDAVREELGRILSSPLFSASRRYPLFLQYVVEKALQEEFDDLKERKIGAEVFHRDPSYDTKADPVVRVTAGEVRKRLAQYYYEPRHQREIRIELASGSYVPEFHAAPAALPAPRSPHLRVEAGKAAPHESGSVKAVAAHPFRRKVALAGAATVVVVGALSLMLSVGPWARSSPLEEFWQPLLSSQNPALLCMGQLRATQVELEPNAARNRFDTPVRLVGRGNVYPAEFPVAVLSDAIALSRIASVLQSHQKNYAIRGEGSTSFADLRGGPVVLIGAFNNDWTIRLNDQLRFRFQMNPEGDQWWITDAQKPGDKIGFLRLGNAVEDFKQDYAVVSRLYDPSTEQPTVIVAGLTPYGTLAAGEFVTDTRYLEEFIRQAPRDWEHKNLQVLIDAKVVNGSVGAPHVAAVYTW
ncbi:MAG TPA: hypothetical protein VLV49_04525 [Terriglobales bacterium]|nr:hypothetical protein [Terriglobales bacterium]